MGRAPERRPLPHDVPPWADYGAVFFVTVCAVPRGRNHLCQKAVATGLWESVRHRQGAGQWWVHLFLVMPDHVHALLTFDPDFDLQPTVVAWKRYTSRQLGIPWQRDFLDHRLRGDESFEQKVDYIRHNPVRAGLVADPDEWPYMWPG
jgi:REP element-mobilizing transposase RayT